jgi:hypothetical protein
MIKKLTLISLVASACLLSNVQAADTVKEALENGKVKGSIKAYYFQEDSDSTGRSSNLHFGGLLNYETADFLGLRAGATFQVSSIGDMHGDESIFKSDEDASGSVLSEAFLEYTRSNTSVKIGRQFIGTPLLAGSGSRMVRQSFQGYTLVNTDIPDTKIVAAYADRFQKRTDGEGNPGKFTKSFNTNGALDGFTLENGVYTVYAENKSITNVTAQLQYLNAVDAFESYYADAAFDVGTKSNVVLKAQYIGTNYDDSTTNGNFYAIRVSASYDYFNLKLSASQNPSNGDVESGVGYGADYALTASEIAGGYYAYNANAKAYQINVGTTIARVGLNLIHSEYDRRNVEDETETNLVASYDIVKNLNLNLLQTYFDGSSDKNYETRVKLTYSF